MKKAVLLSNPERPAAADPPAPQTTDRLTQASERIAERAAHFLLSRPFLGFCVAVIAVCVAYRCLERPFDRWNDVRLARTFALLGGQEIYPNAETGPITAGIYGPVGFAAYSPAAFFSSPDRALVVGVLLSILMGLAPVLLLFFHPRLCPDADHTLRALLLCSVFFHLYFASAQFGLWNIHVDAPAIALCGLGLCGVLLHGDRERLSWILGFSVVAFALAPWAKQTTVPLLLAPLVYFWVIGNRRAAIEFIAGLVLVEALITAALGAWFGFDRLYFSLVEVPSRHPRNISELASAGTQVEDLLDMAALTVLAIFSACLLRPQTKPDSDSSHTSFDWGGWPIFLTAALLPLPTAILGRIKDGGTDNNYAMVDYFLTIAAALCLLRLTALPAFRAHPVLPRALPTAVALLLCIQMSRTIPDLIRLRGQIHAFARGTWSQRAYEFARERPGEVYFPWRPLATLLAEKRLYHVTYGVYQRELAGFPVTPDHLRRYLPKSMRYVAMEGEITPYARKVLPEFRCRVEVSGLAGWTVVAHERDDACALQGSGPTVR